MFPNFYRRELTYMPKILLVLFSIALAQISFAQRTIIAGTVPTNPEDEVTLYTLEDLVSGQKQVVKTVYADAAGNFQFQVFPEGIEQRIIRVGERNIKLFVEPDRVYELTIPEFPSDKPKQFFTANNWVDPVFDTLPPNDINALISHFNYRYERFFSENYTEIAKSKGSGHRAYKKSKKGNLQKTRLITKNDSIQQDVKEDSYYQLVLSFEEESDSLYQAVNKPFFDHYREYAIGVMKLSAGLQHQPAFDAYLKDRSVLAHHPEYLNFFNAFHGSVFFELTQDDEGMPLKTALNNADGYQAVSDALEEVYPFAQDPVARDLLIITQVQRIFAQDYFSKNALLKLLSELEENTSEPELETMAANVYQDLSKSMAGYPLESFKLLNKKNEMVTLRDFEGQFVYISFFTTWCQSCLRELSMLESLQKEYGRDITFLSISMDHSYPDYKSFLENHMNYKWQFLFGAGDKLLQEKLGVYSVPHFIMIDPNGKKMFSYTKMPSEGIEKVFHKIKYEANKGEKIKVWDD